MDEADRLRAELDDARLIIARAVVLARLQSDESEDCNGACGCEMLQVLAGLSPQFKGRELEQRPRLEEAFIEGEREMTNLKVVLVVPCV